MFTSFHFFALSKKIPLNMKTKILFVLLFLPFLVFSQVIDPKETAKRKAEDRTNSGIDRTLDKGFDKIEEGIGSIFKKKNKKSKKSGEENTSDSEPNEKSAEVENTQTSNSKPSRKTTTSSSKFDFEQGSKVLYFDDFQRLNIGDFPAEFNTNSSGEVVTLSGKDGKWLSMTKNGSFVPESIKELPENFTLEFEVGLIGNDPGNNYSGFGLNFATDKESLLREVLFPEGSSILYLHPGADMAMVQVLPVGSNEIYNEIPMPQWSSKGETFAKISIWRQKGRLRLYANESKIVDMPMFFLENKPYRLAFFRSFFEDCELVITNLRFAVAGEDTRSKLITEGRLVTNGILFDVNSDNIRPESGVVLRDIAKTLQENPTVRVKIIGHTDSDGADAANLTLSQKRAAAVKNALNNFYGIDANRMETDGKGESDPAQSNSTAEGKAANRRVEFVKL